VVINCWSSIREFWGIEESDTRVEVDVEVDEEREEAGRYSGAGMILVDSDELRALEGINLSSLYGKSSL
jgi:hypothetical protein